MSYFWDSKRVLLTGGGGFLGHHVIDELFRRGAKQVFAPPSSLYDLTNRQSAKRVLMDTSPDVVFHLAAKVGGIGANAKHPGAFFRDNMLMGINLLEEARLEHVCKVVIAGTVCAYPKFAIVPFREEDLWDGYPEETNAPYGIAKKALLVMAQAYRQEYGCNFVMLFPVNLYGPEDNFDLESSHVIPAMIRKFVSAQSRKEDVVHLWGDGSPTREFLYVVDAARGFVDAAEKYDDPEPVNLGAGFEISMRDLAAKISAACGFEGSVHWDATRPNGQPRRRLDVSQARERFGFVSTTGLDDGLKSTIAWYREHSAKIAAREHRHGPWSPA